MIKQGAKKSQLIATSQSHILQSNKTHNYFRMTTIICNLKINLIS